MILHNKVRRLKNSSVMTSRTPSLYSSLPRGLPHQLHSKTVYSCYSLAAAGLACHPYCSAQRSGKASPFQKPPAGVFLVSQAGIGIYSVPKESLDKGNGIALSYDSAPTRLFSLLIYQVSWILSYPQPNSHPVLICRT